MEEGLGEVPVIKAVRDLFPVTFSRNQGH
jgi:hypothetical protein